MIIVLIALTQKMGLGIYWSVLSTHIHSLTLDIFHCNDNVSYSLPKAAHSVDARKAMSLQNELDSASQQLEMNQKVILVCAASSCMDRTSHLTEFCA